MATSLQGITDYIPQIQSFKPDLNFYSNVLQTRQSAYDTAHKQISQQYGALLNAPMLRDENIQLRDKFFKDVQGDLKKISKLDLSQEQNVSTAMNVFKPFYENKHMVNDMVWTKQKNNALQVGENMRSCIDPEKCGGSYWDNGVKKIAYETEEFKNASRDEALQMAAPRYVPLVNLNKNAIKAAKDAGFNITQDTVKGGYIISDTNGNLLSGTNAKWGILPNYLYGIFKDDQKVMDVFRTKAYVARKDYGKQNAIHHGGNSDAAEMEYTRAVLAPSIKQLTEDAIKSKSMYDETDNNLKVLQKQAKNNGGVVSNSPDDSLMQSYSRILEGKAAAEAHHDKVMDTINTTVNLEDPKALKQRADDIIAYNGFRTEIWNAANEYAMGTAKQERKVDPYSLESVRFKHDLQKTDYEFESWKKKKDYESGALVNQLMSLGLSENDAIREASLSGTGGLSQSRVDKLLRSYGKASAKPTAFFGGQGATDANIALIKENDNTIDQHHALLAKSSFDYLKKSAESLKNSYNQKDPDIKKNALATLKSIFGGTNFDVEGFLNNSVTTEDIDKIGESNAVGRYKVASNLAEKPEGRYWQNDKLLVQQAETNKNQQVYNQMFQHRGEAVKTMINNWSKDIASDTHNSVEDKEVELTKMASIIGAGGGIKPYEEAKKAFVNSAAKHYYGEPSNVTVDDSGGYYKYSTKGEPVYVSHEQRVSEARKKAEDVFSKKEYESLEKEYGSRFTTVGGRQFAGSSTLVGSGGKAVQSAIEYSFNPVESRSPNTEIVLNTIKTLAANPAEAVPMDPKNPLSLDNFLRTFEQDVNSGNGLHNNASGTIAQEKIPGELGDKVRYRITPSLAHVKSQVPSKLYDPKADYSWVVEVPEGVDQTGFAQNTKLSGAEMIMNIPGKTLTYTNPNYGNVTLHHDENGFYRTGVANSFDRSTGEWYEDNIKTGYYGKTDADAAYDDMVLRLKEYNDSQRDLERTYLRTHSQKK